MKLPSCVMPVAKISNLKKEIVQVQFNLQSLNIVKRKGEYYLYPHRCPHRGTDLLHGRLEGDNVVCPYHGWQMTPTGEAIHPKTQQRVCRIKTVKLQKKWGFVWFVPEGKEIHLEADENQIFCGSLEFSLSAPFHVVLDNFNEGSHTPFVHRFLGPKVQDIPKVDFRFEDRGDHTFIEYVGPQKSNFIFRAMVPFQKVGWYINWKTSYRPPLMQYDSRWYTKRNSKTLFTNRNYYYILPDGKEKTKLFAFVYNSTPGLTKYFPFLVKWSSLIMTWNQVMEDEVFYPKIADLPEDFRGLNLDEDDQAVKNIRLNIDLERL